MRLIFLSTFLLLLVLFSGGCKSMQGGWFGPKPTPLPIVFATTPTLEQMKTEINRRFANIQSLSTDSASISSGDSPIPLNSCSVAYEKPHKLRVRGGTSLSSGPLIDFGSNNELFWFWYKQVPEKEIYYAAHERFATCPVRNAIPIEPEWLIESLGLVELKEGDTHSGPTRSPDGNLQITTQMQTPRGTYSRTIMIHPQTAALMQHLIYDPAGKLMVAAMMSNHTIDPSSGIVYAQRVEILVPASKATLTLHLRDVKFNIPNGFNPSAFEMPRYEGFIPTDICSEEFQRRYSPGNMLVPPRPADVFPNQTTPTSTEYQGYSPRSTQEPAQNQQDSQNPPLVGSRFDANTYIIGR